MLSRSITVALISGAMLGPVAAGQLSPEEARQFIAGKYFAFTCFDGSRGGGRIMSDGSVAGTIQFGGTGPVRLAHLPINTIRVSSTAVCASLKGIPFEPCFSVDKTDEVELPRRGLRHGLRLLRLPQARQRHRRDALPRSWSAPARTAVDDPLRRRRARGSAEERGQGRAEAGAGHAGAPPLAGLIFSTPVGLRTSLRWGEVPSACR